VPLQLEFIEPWASIVWLCVCVCVCVCARVCGCACGCVFSCVSNPIPHPILHTHSPSGNRQAFQTVPSITGGRTMWRRVVQSPLEPPWGIPLIRETEKTLSSLAENKPKPGGGTEREKRESKERTTGRRVEILHSCLWSSVKDSYREGIVLVTSYLY